jgi:uncharacterized protein (TIGR02466 family)
MDAPALLGFEPLFASPLLRFALPDAAALNAMLVAEARAMRAAGPGMSVSNQHGWHSAMDLFHRSEPGCAALCRHILAALRNATLRVSPGFDFSTKALQVEGWININSQGSYNTPHSHAGWAWSGTYYAAVPENAPGRSGLLEFLDPRAGISVISVEGAGCFATKMQVRPKPGEMVIFPAYLTHWVYPNELAGERVSVAFNARFAPRPR